MQSLAYELVAEVPWSLTLEEDAVIAMAAEVRSTLVRNAVEVIDDVLLNADTTAVNNINADGATISASEAGKGHWLLGFDGLLHLPLVGNATQGNSHGADPDAAMYNEVRGMLGKYGVRPSELAYVTDVSTYIKSLGIDEFRTLDKLGPQATILSGQLAQVDGIPVIVAEEMAKSDDDGKVTSGATNTKLDFTHFRRHERGILRVDDTERPGVSEYRGQLRIVKNLPTPAGGAAQERGHPLLLLDFA